MRRALQTVRVNGGDPLPLADREDVETVLRLEAAQLPFGASLIAVSAIVNDAILAALLVMRDAGHPVGLIVVYDGQQPPAMPLPGELDIYFVNQNWIELESLELD